MTALRRTLESCVIQREIIQALRAGDETRVADRLERCMLVRLTRRRDGGWPWTCGSAGCRWCGPAQSRRWWLGIERWAIASGDPISLTVVPLQVGPNGIRRAVARLRRLLRDMRDRTGRQRRHWRHTAI